MGRSYVALGRCHDGIGSAEGKAGILLEEDVFFPEEGEAVVQDGWKVGGMDAADGIVKEKDNEADVDGVVSCP